MSTMEQAYEALVAKDRQTAAQIAAGLGDQRYNVWSSLERLRDKGLVAKEHANGEVFWVLSSPRYFAAMAPLPHWLEPGVGVWGAQ